MEGDILIDQKDKIRKLEIPKSQKGFAIQRSMCKYIGVNTRPDVCTTVKLVAPGAEKTEYD